MFIDASALCAILLAEPEAEVFEQKLKSSRYRATSAVAVFETVRALSRETDLDLAPADRSSPV